MVHPARVVRALGLPVCLSCLGFVLALSGCGGGTAVSAPAPDPDSRTLCTTDRSQVGPRLPLQQTRAQDLVLPIGPLPDQLVFDYRDVFPYWVTRAAVRFDFDRTLEPPPVEATFSEACPAGLPLEPIAGSVGADGVFTGVLEVSDEQTGASRETRLSFSRGPRSVDLTLPEVPTEGDAWVLFEPASGRGRVALARASWGTVISVDGLPSGPGELAVVGAPEVFAEDGGVYVPADFGGAWRAYASPWYGAVLGLEEGNDVVRSLAPIRGVGDASGFPPAISAQQGFEAGVSTQLLAMLDREQAVAVTVPCPASELMATVFGFGEVSSGGESAARGETLALPLSCMPGASGVSIELQLTLQNQRLAFIRLEYLP